MDREKEGVPPDRKGHLSAPEVADGNEEDWQLKIETGQERVAAGSPGIEIPPLPFDDSESETVKTSSLPEFFRKFRSSLILATVGFGILALSYWALPPENDVATPPYVTMIVNTKAPFEAIEYSAYPFSPSVTVVKIEAVLPLQDVGKSAIAADLKRSWVRLDLPPGIEFDSCPDPCIKEPALSGWTKSFSFSSISGIVFFSIRSHSFSYALNNVNASVAMPEVQYFGSGVPDVTVKYNFPDANTYDWSSFPTENSSGTSATWNEQLINGTVAARVAVGVNQGKQEENDRRNFAAGALVGIAGGAFLGALQEALSARKPKEPEETSDP